VMCYFLGILIQLPFVASALYTGPIARALGGIDLSWIVGLLVTSPTYYWLAKKMRSRQAADDTPPDHKVLYI
jgi:NCS1 family nucleobase:cation symporter-1